MIGRAAIDGPWVFRQVRAALGGAAEEPEVAGLDERLALYARVLGENVAERGEKFGVAVTKRHARPWLGAQPGGAQLAARLLAAGSVAAVHELLDGARAPLARLTG
jgi:tRNA-dihydrouridine synthase